MKTLGKGKEYLMKEGSTSLSLYSAGTHTVEAHTRYNLKRKRNWSRIKGCKFFTMERIIANNKD
jgi:hypothetical protein